MNVLRVALAVLALAIAGCGFHLRREAELPGSMQRVRIEIADRFGALARDLRGALQRAGSEVVDAPGAGVATLRIPVNTLATEVLSVGSNARASEYALRYRVEFEVLDAAGGAILPMQTIEMSRDFVFDSTQARGLATETELLGAELERDMVQAILRRIEAIGKFAP